MTQAETMAYNEGVRDALALARFLADRLGPHQGRPRTMAMEGLDALADEGRALMLPVAANRQISDAARAA